MNTPVARCKLKLTEIRSHHWGGAKTFVFTTEYDDSILEDRRFYDATPSGKFEMTVNNKKVIDAMELGQSFYVDFTAK